MIKERVEKLRELMRERGLSAYIIPSADPHQSEYVAEHWKSRAWISGFTGSAGTIVVTLDKAGLWTDGRYYIQADKQLQGSGIDLFKAGLTGVPSYTEWLEGELEKNDCVGIDGKLFAISRVSEMKESFDKKGIKINKKYDLINEIWVDRPSMPSDKVFVHDTTFAGKSTKEKLNEVREEMKKKKANYFLLTSLDDIAWLFNLRGSDVPNNPVFMAYALISLESASLFIEATKVEEDVRINLMDSGVEVKSYEAIKESLGALTKGDKVILDYNRVNIELYDAITLETLKSKEVNLTTPMKAVKNDIEIKNLRNCQVKDGIAMVKFLCWLDNNIGKIDITEISASDKLESFRKEQDLFMGISFDSIAGYKEHAAMMHYKAEPSTQFKLEAEGMYLIDSGGQYLDGTTDITRTIVLGKLTEEEKRDFTLVLKGHICLSTAKFLYGTTGSNLDILARQPIWEQGIDYKCGTGHGVGFMLNVHEGPQGFSQYPNSVKLEKGMVITNEPGIYKEGKHGIRIENTLLVVEDENTEFGQFMRFETISYCPIDLRGIDVALLTDKEKTWINEYHRKVYELLSPSLDGQEKMWLMDRTRAI